MGPGGPTPSPGRREAWSLAIRTGTHGEQTMWGRAHRGLGLKGAQGAREEAAGAGPGGQWHLPRGQPVEGVQQQHSLLHVPD